MNIILLTLAFGGIAIFEIPGLLQKKYIKELLIFLILLGTSYLFALLIILGYKLPSPAKIITLLVEKSFNIFKIILTPFD